MPSLMLRPGERVFVRYADGSWEEATYTGPSAARPGHAFVRFRDGRVDLVHRNHVRSTACAVCGEPGRSEHGGYCSLECRLNLDVATSYEAPEPGEVLEALCRWANGDVEWVVSVIRYIHDSGKALARNMAERLAARRTSLEALQHLVGVGSQESRAQTKGA